MLRLSRLLVKDLIINGSYIVVSFGVLYYKLNYLSCFRFNIRVSSSISIFAFKRNRIKRQIRENFRFNSSKFLNYDIFFIVNHFNIFFDKKCHVFL